MPPKASDHWMNNKPKLLVILGAGSSIPCGMPSVENIDKQMKCWSREWEPESPTDAGRDVFNVLWDAFERYYGTNHYCIRPNYERVLGEMIMLASWLSPPPFGTPFADAVRDSRTVCELDWLHDCSDKNAARKRVLEQHSFLFKKLANYMRNLSQALALDIHKPAFSDYVEFFHKLQEHFELGIYNLNYDTIAHTAWPEAFTGFDSSGAFDPLCISQRREWGFIYHIHGSVHHCISHETIRPWIIWKEELGEAFTDSGISAADMAQNFKSIPLTTLIAGGFKLDQLLADPYQTFYSTLVRHVYEADAILIVGYGFGDLHVNRVLRNRFEGPNHDDRPHPQVAILEKSCPQRYRTARLGIHEFWSWELTHTLKTSFKKGSGRPSLDNRTVKDFIEHAMFETDTNNRVAIWHGGFREALSAVHKITSWLLMDP